MPFSLFSLKGLNKVKETEVLLVLSQVSRTLIFAQLLKGLGHEIELKYFNKNV
jgi:hypothetical protein